MPPLLRNCTTGAIIPLALGCQQGLKDTISGGTHDIPVGTGVGEQNHGRHPMVTTSTDWSVSQHWPLESSNIVVGRKNRNGSEDPKASVRKF